MEPPNLGESVLLHGSTGDERKSWVVRRLSQWLVAWCFMLMVFWAKALGIPGMSKWSVGKTSCKLVDLENMPIDRLCHECLKQAFYGKTDQWATNSSISGFDEARKFLRKHGAIYPGVPWQHLWMFHWEFAESNYSPEIGNPKTTGRWWINFSCIKLVWLDFDQLFLGG